MLAVPPAKQLDQPHIDSHQQPTHPVQRGHTPWFRVSPLVCTAAGAIS